MRDGPRPCRAKLQNWSRKLAVNALLPESGRRNVYATRGASSGRTANQIAAAGGIESLGFGSSVYDAVLMSSAPQARQAFDALSGEMHASTAGVLVDESLYARSAILGRLRQASYGGNTRMAALTNGRPQAFAAESTEAIESALAYAKSPVVKAPMRAPAATSDVVVWAQGFGAWGRFNGDGNAATLRRDLAGFFTGVDTRVGDAGRVGIAAGYTASRNNTDGRGSANVESGHIAGYGGWSFGSVNLRAGGDFAFDFRCHVGDWGQSGHGASVAITKRMTRMYGPAVRRKRISSSWW